MHLFIYHRHKVANLAGFGHVHTSDPVYGLFRSIKVLKENHNRLRRRIRLKLIRWTTRIENTNSIQLPWKGRWWHRGRVSNRYVLPPYCFVSPQQLWQKLGIAIKLCEVVADSALAHSLGCRHPAGLFYFDGRQTPTSGSDSQVNWNDGQRDSWVYCIYLASTPGSWVMFDRGQFFSSKLAKSNPSCRVNMSSVMTWNKNHDTLACTREK